MGNAYRFVIRKSEGKRPTGEPRHRWEGNIKMDLTRNSMYVDMDLFGL
jgi:hypothetical protein